MTCPSKPHRRRLSALGLRRMRGSLVLTQAEVSAWLGVGCDQYKHWEQGMRNPVPGSASAYWEVEDSLIVLAKAARKASDSLVARVRELVRAGQYGSASRELLGGAR